MLHRPELGRSYGELRSENSVMFDRGLLNQIHVKMKNTEMKFKLRVKVTGRVKAPMKSMLSPVLTHCAVYNPTYADNAPRKGQYQPPKTMVVVTWISNAKLS
jgi:hypothetical protein